MLAWAAADDPTAEQISEALDDFERLVYAGLDPAQSGCWAAIRHDGRNKDGQPAVHVHCLFARIELQTGKVFNPAPPGWQRDFGPLRDRLNLEHGWSRPDSPELARADISSAWTNRSTNALRSEIGLFVENQIRAGLVVDRESLVETVETVPAFRVTRQGRDYVTVTVTVQDGDQERIRKSD